MGAAVDILTVFYAVAHDPAAAMLSSRSEPVNGTLERVEGVALPIGDDIEGTSIVVAADITFGHGGNLPLSGPMPVVTMDDDWRLSR
jgi:hypothetical protein